MKRGIRVINKIIIALLVLIIMCSLFGWNKAIGYDNIYDGQTLLKAVNDDYDRVYKLANTINDNFEEDVINISSSTSKWAKYVCEKSKYKTPWDDYKTINEMLESAKYWLNNLNNTISNNKTI